MCCLINASWRIGIEEGTVNLLAVYNSRASSDNTNCFNEECM